MRPRQLPVLIAVGLLLPTAGRAEPPLDPPPTIPAVSLRDQFGGSTSLTVPLERPVIVLVSDRDGSKAAGRWQRRLQSVAAGSGAQVVAVADLQGVPRLIRGIVRSRMPADTSARVLLDWEGSLARRVRGETAHLVAAAYGADGRLATWAQLSLDGEDDATAQRLVDAVRRS